MNDAQMISQIIRPDEHFYWTVTGSIRDLKFQPMTWLIVIGLIGLLLDTLLKIIEKKVLKAWGGVK